MCQGLMVIELRSGFFGVQRFYLVQVFYCGKFVRRCLNFGEAKFLGDSPTSISAPNRGDRA